MNSKIKQTHKSKKSNSTDKHSLTGATDSANFLTGVFLYIVPNGIIKARRDIFKTQLRRYGGIAHDKLLADPTDVLTHVLVEDNLTGEQVRKYFHVQKLEFSLLSDVQIVRSAWLSACLKDKRHVDESSYTFDIEISKVAPFVSSHDAAKTIEDKQPTTSKTYDDITASQEKPTCSVKRKRQSSSDDEITPGGEERSSATTHGAVKKFSQLAKLYSDTNDKWRALGYQKAISALKRHSKPITTWEDAKALPGVGQRLADKIWEIIESGELRKLNELSASDEMTAISLFTKVYGVGATTARSWVDQGFRTLDDLRERANLTRQQKIGLRLYDDLLLRMPREEAGQIESYVREVALSIQPGLVVMACGSYRRGKPTCGDVDVLITHSSGASHKGLFSKVLNELRGTGFLTDDLVTQEDSGNQKKYLGVCKLPGHNTIHRRLDIIVVPHHEFAAAQLYFTGSAHLNRSMRNLAGKMGMSLNEHSLKKGVIRQHGEKITEGTPLPTPTEESIFEHLGLTYRPPNERDH